MTTRWGVLAYGARPGLQVECHGAILSALAHAPEGLEPIVLTDEPRSYRWLEDSVTIEHLPAATLDAWRGPAQDRYRPKIEALRRLAQSGSAHVVLADVDTLVRRDLGPLIARLESGAFLLHRREYALAAPPRRGDRMLKHEILGRAWHGITPGPHSAMWNGGVIGCPQAKLEVVNEVIAVFDSMRQASRHFAVEQLAYSVVFEARGTIVEAAPWIDHYWANRSFFRRAIERELAAMLLTGMRPAEAAARWRDHPITGPLDGRPSRRQRLAQRLGRLLGRTGHPDD